MNEKNIRQTNLRCDECNGEIIHDLIHDVKFCSRCGLVISAPYMHEFGGVE